MEAIIAEEPFAQPACLYCGETNSHILFTDVQDRLGVTSGSWQFLSCDCCGSANLSPRPKASELIDFYPEIYTPSQQVNQGGLLKRVLSFLEFKVFYRLFYRSQLRTILKHTDVKPFSGATLLDVGCGHGLRLEVFRRAGIQPTGVEFRESAVAHLREKGIPAVCADIDNLDEALTGSTFDLVTAYYVVEHVADVRGLMQSVFRLLKPGGWFAAAVPFVDSLQIQLLKSRCVAVTEAPRHVSIPSMDGFINLSSDLGFVNPHIATDTLLMNSATLALGLFPKAATTYFQETTQFDRVFQRLLGAAATVATLPFSAYESYVVRKPANGVLFAQKPIS